MCKRVNQRVLKVERRKEGRVSVKPTRKVKVTETFTQQDLGGPQALSRELHNFPGSETDVA